jgi:hypothetical protein
MFSRKPKLTEEEQIKQAKKQFVDLITDKLAYREFKTIVGMSEKYAVLSAPLFSFLENYSSYKDIVSNANFQPSDRFDPKHIKANLFVIAKFQNAALGKSRQRTITVPDNVCHQLLRFYATFIAEGAPLEVPFLNKTVRERVATELLPLSTDKTINDDLFDQVAELVLDALFCRCFPRYLTAKNISMPIMKAATQVHKEWSSLNAESDLHDAAKKPDVSEHVARKDIKEKKWSFPNFSSKENLKLKASKESMVNVLENPKLYAEFADFVTESHCEENLVLFESFSKLELRTREVSSRAPSLARFLDPNFVDESSNDLVPLSIVPLFLFFHRMFVVPNSPYEVNLTHSCRKDIENQLENIKTAMIKVSIFDGVIDHVLLLLYQNSFVKYVKEKGAE